MWNLEEYPHESQEPEPLDLLHRLITIACCHPLYGTVLGGGTET